MRGFGPFFAGSARAACLATLLLMWTAVRPFGQNRHPYDPLGSNSGTAGGVHLKAGSAILQASTFRVDSEMVLLGVSARDSQGVAVEGLSRDAFEVFEDGRSQNIVHFHERESPQAMVLAMDVSSSMKDGLLEEARLAALELVSYLDGRGETAVLAFNHAVELVQPFTRRESELREAITGLEASGGTALLDALGQGIDLARHHEYPRQVVVLLTDGKDQDSRARFDEIERRLAGSGVLIYSIGVYDRLEKKRLLNAGKYVQEPHFDQNLNPVWILSHCADLSGGLAFFPDTRDSLRPAFSLIGNDLNHFYQIGYLPPSFEKPRFRRIRVTLSRPEMREEVTLRTRRGYYR